MKKTILVTGGAGFIGSNFVDLVAKEMEHDSTRIIVLDKLTYAGNIANLNSHNLLSYFQFIHGDIGNYPLVVQILKEYQVDHVVNFAAESHVDNSILGPKLFIETNILGTFNLLEAARTYFSELDPVGKQKFRFLHVSTDEVFGSLDQVGKFDEASRYAPNSPYSASKAASDHLVRAWGHTYGIPTITTHCSNNYGPRQFSEKLIPHMIECALNQKMLPVYGTGQNIRDWIHVEDHCRGVLLALLQGKPGETYCFGGNSERKNIDVVNSICSILDQLAPLKNNQSFKNSIAFVEDRKGHDWRYAIDDSKAQRDLNFTRKYKNFEDGLFDTVKWYLDSREWSLKLDGAKQ